MDILALLQSNPPLPGNDARTRLRVDLGSLPIHNVHDLSFAINNIYVQYTTTEQFINELNRVGNVVRRDLSDYCTCYKLRIIGWALRRTL